MPIKSIGNALSVDTESETETTAEMGSSSLYFFRYYYLVIVMYFYLVLVSGKAIESPQYTVMHSESDFEIRLYLDSSWISALVRGATSFDQSTKDGFHRFTSKPTTCFICTL